MVASFSFNKRNTNHWDVWANNERIFRIRGGGVPKGEPKEFSVIGENSCRDLTPNGWVNFKSLTTATAWITDQLMEEPEED